MNSLVKTPDKCTLYKGQHDYLAWFTHEHAEFPDESPIDYYRLESEAVSDYHQVSIADGEVLVIPADIPMVGTLTVMELVTYADELQRVARAAIHLNAAQAVTA